MDGEVLERKVVLRRRRVDGNVDVWKVVVDDMLARVDESLGRL